MALFVKYKCDWCSWEALCKPWICSRSRFTTPASWMARLSVSLAADALRCLRGRQILLDTYKHKDVCRVVTCSVCAAYIIRKSLFFSEVVSPSSVSSTGKSDIYSPDIFLFITAQKLFVKGNNFLNWLQYLPRRIYIRILAQTFESMNTFA